MAALGLRFDAEMDGPPLGFTECPAYSAVVSYLNTMKGDRLFWWNDAQPTAEHVIEVLRAAAVIEAAREDQNAAWETYAEVVTS